MNSTEVAALRDLLYSAIAASRDMAKAEKDRTRKGLLVDITIKLRACTKSLADYVMTDGAEPHEPPRT